MASRMKSAEGSLGLRLPISQTPPSFLNGPNLRCLQFPATFPYVAPNPCAAVTSSVARLSYWCLLRKSTCGSLVQNPRHAVAEAMDKPILPLDFAEKRRAYFDEIDAFELCLRD